MTRNAAASDTGKGFTMRATDSMPMRARRARDAGRSCNITDPPVRRGTHSGWPSGAVATPRSPGFLVHARATPSGHLPDRDKLGSRRFGLRAQPNHRSAAWMDGLAPREDSFTESSRPGSWGRLLHGVHRRARLARALDCCLRRTKLWGRPSSATSAHRRHFRRRASGRRANPSVRF